MVFFVNKRFLVPEDESARALSTARRQRFAVVTPAALPPPAQLTRDCKSDHRMSIEASCWAAALQASGRYFSKRHFHEQQRECALHSYTTSVRSFCFQSYRVPNEYGSLLTTMTPNITSSDARAAARCDRRIRPYARGSPRLNSSISRRDIRQLFRWLNIGKTSNLHWNETPGHQQHSLTKSIALPRFWR